MIRTTWLCVLLASLALSPASPEPTHSSRLGPGAVLHVHERLLTAADRGDVEGVRRALGSNELGARYREEGGWSDAESFLAFVPATRGAARRTDDPERAAELLVEWARSKDTGEGQDSDGWETAITDAWLDCHGPELTFAALEVERRRPTEAGLERRPLRLSTLLKYEEGEGWRIFHLHLSESGPAPGHDASRRPDRDS